LYEQQRFIVWRKYGDAGIYFMPTPRQARQHTLGIGHIDWFRASHQVLWPLIAAPLREPARA
jgi:hypothetical protein